MLGIPSNECFSREHGCCETTQLEEVMKLYKLTRRHDIEHFLRNSAFTPSEVHPSYWRPFSKKPLSATSKNFTILAHPSVCKCLFPLTPIYRNFSEIPVRVSSPPRRESNPWAQRAIWAARREFQEFAGQRGNLTAVSCDSNENKRRTKRRSFYKPVKPVWWRFFVDAASFFQSYLGNLLRNPFTPKSDQF